MSNQSTETHRFEDRTIDTQSRSMGATASIAERSTDGSLAILAGGTLLARALWSHRRIRAVILALAGAALVGFGLRQRRSRDSNHQTGDTGTVDHSVTGTSEQRVESHQDDANPRGTSGEPNVETKTAPDEGSVQFTESQNEGLQSKPHLDEGDEDPRLDEGDEVTEVDLSEASLADEASEAAGPVSAQAQPTQTDDPEPERTHEDDAQMDAGEPDPVDETVGDEDETTGDEEKTVDDEGNSQP